ncbi:MAG: hypothetical protein DRP46_12780, partial [Candidatus Zixiibacteriota bacterium]
VSAQARDDDGGLSNAAITTVTVLNVAPTVDAGPDQAGDEAETFQFTGNFTDPGDDSHIIHWDFGDGDTVGGSLAPTHVYTEPGTFTVILTITDDDGGVDSDTLFVTVNNLPPTVSANGPYTGTAGAPVTLHASASDPGGTIFSYAWDLDDDGVFDDGIGSTAVCTWTLAAIHNVAVRVTDAQGLSDTEATTVTIVPAALHHIVLSPQSATIYGWETQTYTTEAFDIYDNSRGDITPQTAFSIVEPDDGGYWSANVYHPLRHGDWTVRAVHTDTLVTVTDTGMLLVCSPLMHLTHSDDPDPVEAGDLLTYTIFYSNTGNLAATNVVISDFLDSNVIYVTATPPAQGIASTRYWTFSSVPVGGPYSIAVTVRATRPLTNGTVLTNRVQLDADWLGEGRNGPLSTTVTTTVHARPVLTITKFDFPDPVTAGGMLRYTIIISNTGNENATNVIVSEQYDPHITFFSANPPPTSGDNVWVFPVLSVDEYRTIDIFAQTDSVLPVGTIFTNQASLESNQTTPITAVETTVVTSVSELNVYKLDSPDNRVPAGELLMYVITYQTSGSAPAESVVITETYDHLVTFLSATPAPDPGTDNVWTIGDLPVNHTGSIIVQVRVDTPLPNDTLLVNRVAIDSAHTEPLIYTETTTVSSAPDLTFLVTDWPDPVEAGGPLTYTLNYANDGNADATQVVITATLDAKTVFATASLTPSGHIGNVWYWHVDNIPGEGGAAALTIRTVVTTPLPNQTALYFTARLTDAEGDLLEEAVETRVRSAPVLHLEKRPRVAIVKAGEWLTYTLSYSNTGNEIATNVIVSDTLPPDVTFAGALPTPTAVAGRTLYWEIGSLTPTVSAASDQIVLTARVHAPLPNGTLLTNTAAIDSDQTTPQRVVATTTVHSAPILHLRQTDAPDPVLAGEILTYTLVYSNTGNETATHVVISDVLDANVALLQSWPAPDGGVSQHMPYWFVEPLIPDGPRWITVRVRLQSPLPRGTPHLNTAAIDSDQTTPQRVVATTTVHSAPILHLRHTDAPDPVLAGEILTYTLVYSNTGNETATHVVISDVLDANVALLQSWPAPDGGIAHHAPYWAIGNLAPDGIHTI